MKKIIAFLLFICSIVSFSSCYVTGALFGGYAPPYDDPSDYPEYPVYQSAYTEEEHIVRLTELTKSGVWRETTGNWFEEHSGLADCAVEIVYAFCDNDPEFFVIDLTFENEARVGHGGDPTDKGYLLGYILNDEYYLLNYDGGDNPWKVAGYQEYKKYFGSYYYAVKIDGKMTAIFRLAYRYDHTVEVDIKEEKFIHLELSEYEQRDFMQYNYRERLMVKYEWK